MNNKNCNIEISRFIAALIIVNFHNTYIGKGWIYVEFFLFITGYYTAKHFDGKNYINIPKESIIYTISKFIRYLPYTIIGTLVGYCIYILPGVISGEKSISMLILHFIDTVIMDLMLITDSFGIRPIIPTLWYLSAMFVAFPIFSCIMQIRNRYAIMIITSFYSLIFYGNCLEKMQGFSYDIPRVFAGLSVGAFIYEFTYIFGNYINRINKVILTIIELIVFLFPIITVSREDLIRITLLCFLIFLSVELTGLSYTNRIKGKIFLYLGKLSMPMYIFHFVILLLLNSNLIAYNPKIKNILYYGLTIIVSMIVMYFVDHWKWFQTIVSKPLELKD